RYNPRLVAKDYNQIEGSDYDETFSPVVNMYDDLAKDVYMTLPMGFGDANCDKVCKLNKSLYGLKRAPRRWNAMLNVSLDEHAFVQSKPAATPL
ncbi:ribonuclease H-like domain-containing protein, partial [Tanacetum coccineum]